MSDALNNFFDKAGSSINKSLNNNTSLNDGQVWPHSPFDKKGNIKDVNDKNISSIGYLGNFTWVFEKDQNGNLNRKALKYSDQMTPYLSSGINRTDTTALPTTSNSYIPSGQAFPSPISQYGGFTPLQYYRVYNDSWTTDPEKNIDLGGSKYTTRNRWDNTKDAYNNYSNSSNDEDNNDPAYIFKKGPISEYVLTSTLNDDGANKNFINPDSNTKLSLYGSTGSGQRITSDDNEDPVYFGFEIIIKVDSSPILNGQADNFIKQFGGSYDEINYRLDILSEFKKELSRYFKFDRSLNSTESGNPNLFKTDGKKKFYYVSKVTGLHKLSESNLPDKSNSFHKWEDTISLTFFEDTTLNLGTLYTLYKLLYWSRIKGKSIIPENVLRFDCQIIVSELRNFVTVRKALQSNAVDGVDVLKANLSRYRYNLYECQFFFDKPSHEDSIDQSSPPKVLDGYDIQIAWKHSDMVFERYNFDKEQYQYLTNGKDNPFNELDLKSQYLSTESKEPFKPDESGAALLEKIQKNKLESIYKQGIDKTSFSKEGKDLFSQASDNLLNNIKKAALNESQRNINRQFSLLNNSLDKIRNSFGVGRLSQPTNVYFPTQNTQAFGNSKFFFDVQNSLRDFAGDGLSGLLGG